MKGKGTRGTEVVTVAVILKIRSREVITYFVSYFLVLIMLKILKTKFFKF